MDTENNIILAEFMGYQQENKLVYAGMYDTSPKRQLIFDIKGSKYSAKNLKFHKDWNWLMKVVEKIESIEDGIYQVDILQEGCKILKKCSLLIDKTVSKLEPDTTKIKSVYLACVEFIKWYNEQNKK